MSDTKTPETKTETKDQTAAPAAPALPKVGDVTSMVRGLRPLPPGPATLYALSNQSLG